MAWPDCAPPASSNIASKPPKSDRFEENRLCFAKPVFFIAELSPQALTVVNHMETIT
jgi:hypothetical protein